MPPGAEYAFGVKCYGKLNIFDWSEEHGWRLNGKPLSEEERKAGFVFRNQRLFPQRVPARELHAVEDGSPYPGDPDALVCFMMIKPLLS